ncbi:unnamed protein product [Eruca vesicaria subsp. sativa]|uniref:MADS-box domain-containing protein n=1 Tax=Eruca vesicaria subsp. sativa TaxID=29727 RepID=A0ABC8M4T8_ERUVS|nr:unnamed protein product [Eruca vesicaria subsp. sativa]
MVKRGGTKRKISKLEKISKREYLATAFTKRCNGLHSKAAQLCLLADAQIAILATPPSSQSNVSFFSFGHSSVDAVVSAYLTGQRLAPVREEPREEDIGILMARKELGLELWWQKESLSKSKDPQELMDAMKAMERVLIKLRDFVGNNSERDSHPPSSGDNKESDVFSHQGTQDLDETLNLQETCCVPDDDLLPEGFDKIITEEQDQILSICDSFCANEDINNISALSGSLDVCNNQEMDIDELIDWTSFECPAFSDDGVLDSTHGSLLNNFEAAADHDVVSTNPNPPIIVSECVEVEALDEAANDVSTNLYPIYDFDGVEEEGFMYLDRALCEDNLHFSDYFCC